PQRPRPRRPADPGRRRCRRPDEGRAPPPLCGADAAGERASDAARQGGRPARLVRRQPGQDGGAVRSAVDIETSAQMSQEFDVWFTNMLGCAVGISDISWSVTVTASTGEEAMELALVRARKLNDELGLPPHGIRVSESKLRQLAHVFPKKTA